jgi:hypothetical protein
MKTPKASIKKRKMMLARLNLSKQFDELQELREKVQRLESSPRSKTVADDRTRRDDRQILSDDDSSP